MSHSPSNNSKPEATGTKLIDREKPRGDPIPIFLKREQVYTYTLYYIELTHTSLAHPRSQTTNCRRHPSLPWEQHWQDGSHYRDPASGRTDG